MPRILLVLATLALPACDGCRSSAVVEEEAQPRMIRVNIDGGARRRVMPGGEHRPHELRFRLKKQ